MAPTRVWSRDLDATANTPMVAGSERLHGTFLDPPSCRAIDAETGEDVWRFDLDYHAERGLVSDGDTLYFGDTAGTLHALDADTGRERWRFGTGDAYEFFDADIDLVDEAVSDEETSLQLSAMMSDAGQIRATPAVENDTVYVPSFDPALHAVDARTGTERWRADLEGRPWTTPVVHDGTVVVATSFGAVVGVDAETGTERWRRWVQGGVYANPTLAPDEEVVTLCCSGGIAHGPEDQEGGDPPEFEGNFVQLDVHSGEQVRVETVDGHAEHAVRGPDELLFLVLERGLVAVDDRGTEHWRRDHHVGNWLVPTTDGVVVGTSDGRALGLESSTGTEAWCISDLVGTVRPTALDDGRLFVREKDGGAHRFDVTDERFTTPLRPRPPT